MDDGSGVINVPVTGIKARSTPGVKYWPEDAMRVTLMLGELAVNVPPATISEVWLSVAVNVADVKSTVSAKAVPRVNGS
jgi:hypothetical protein